MTHVPWTVTPQSPYGVKLFPRKLTLLSSVWDITGCRPSIYNMIHIGVAIQSIIGCRRSIYNLIHRGVAIQSITGPTCNRHPKSSEHFFLRCSTALELLASLKRNLSFLLDLNHWRDVDFLFNGVAKPNWSNFDKMNYKVVIRVFLWTLWCNKNIICFRNSVKNIPSLVVDAKCSSFLWMSIRSKLLD